MLLDCHTHIGKKTIIASAADLVKSMDDSNIDKSLVFAGKINDQATQILLNDISPFKNRLYGIGSVSPLTAFEHESKNHVLGYLEECFATQKIYGLKFYPGYEWFYPSDASVRDFLNLCIKYNKPAIFHSGDCFNGVSGAKLKYAHPLNFDDLAVEMPELKIIIAHMGYPWIRDAAEVCYKNKNVYADTSGFVYGKFTENDLVNYKNVINEFITVSGGTGKLIFGTDWPISSQESYVKSLTDVLSCLNATAEYGEIMGSRAAELFGIV